MPSGAIGQGALEGSPGSAWTTAVFPCCKVAPLSVRRTGAVSAVMTLARLGVLRDADAPDAVITG
jgi:hypothetical protein